MCKPIQPAVPLNITIDNDYSGSVKVCFYNASEMDVVILRHERIAQVIAQYYITGPLQNQQRHQGRGDRGFGEMDEDLVFIDVEDEVEMEKKKNNPSNSSSPLPVENACDMCGTLKPFTAQTCSNACTEDFFDQFLSQI